MKSRTSVSLIIPTYNRARFLVEALDSVFAQTHIPDEVIVVDDGSTDGTAQVISSYNIKYCCQENRGVSAARNWGIKAASCDWIMFLDSDDLWQKHKVSRQIYFSEQNPSDLIFHTNETWIRNGRFANSCTHHQKYGGWIFECCLPLCVISPSSVMIHRSIFQDVGCFDENLPACEDYDLWLRITLRWQVYFIDEPLIVKRGGHKDQLSRKYFGMDRFRIMALEKILKDPKLSIEQRKRVIEEITEKIDIYANGCRKRNRLDEYDQYQQKREALLREH